MDDARFASMMAEAQRHLGKPYVFGAAGPDSFDCSGFVSYVLARSTHPGFGRTTAWGIYNICTPVSRTNARPGDLIFFTETYNAGVPTSHIGIYIGNGQMIHAGDPVQYTSIDTPYWTQHFYAFGRLSG
jgi:cell wall-associated NlpC family hydrolase